MMVVVRVENAVKHEDDKAIKALSTVTKSMVWRKNELKNRGIIEAIQHCWNQLKFLKMKGIEKKNYGT